MKYILFIVLGISLIVQEGFSQNVVKGFVRNNGEPLDFASVNIPVHISYRLAV